jgi:hypothetical protein
MRTLLTDEDNLRRNSSQRWLHFEAGGADSYAGSAPTNSDTIAARRPAAPGCQGE